MFVFSTFGQYDLTMAGYFSEALRTAKRMIELDPLSPSGYTTTRDAYAALGRREDAQAMLARLRDVGFEELAATRQAFDHFMAGEFDEGITALGDWSMFGQNGQALEELIGNASDPESGLEFLRSWVEETESEADSYLEKTSAKFWYLILGYLDDYWREIEEVAPESTSSWTNAEVLEFNGVVFHASGFRRHPSYIPYAKKYGMLDLWDTRGAPDTCSKTNGRWICE